MYVVFNWLGVFECEFVCFFVYYIIWILCVSLSESILCVPVNEWCDDGSLQIVTDRVSTMYLTYKCNSLVKYRKKKKNTVLK